MKKSRTKRDRPNKKATPLASRTTTPSKGNIPPAEVQRRESLIAETTGLPIPMIDAELREAGVVNKDGSGNTL